MYWVFFSFLVIGLILSAAIWFDGQEEPEPLIELDWEEAARKELAEIVQKIERKPVPLDEIERIRKHEQRSHKK